MSSKSKTLVEKVPFAVIYCHAVLTLALNPTITSAAPNAASSAGSEQSRMMGIYGPRR